MTALSIIAGLLLLPWTWRVSMSRPHQRTQPESVPDEAPDL